MAVTPTLTPKELLAAATGAKSIDELEAIGRECFAPYAQAIADGTHPQAYIKNLPGKQGYTAVFQALNALGLATGVNSRDGKHHVFQNENYKAVYQTGVDSEKESPALSRVKSQGVHIPVADYMAAMLRALKSHNAADLIIGIAAATGRRTIEVAQIGVFSAEQNPADTWLSYVNPDYVYHFQNPAKKRNYDLDAADKPEFTTTSLAQAGDVLAAWKTLRSTPEIKEHLKEVAKVSAAEYNRAIDEGKGEKESMKLSEVAARDLFNKRWATRLKVAMGDHFAFLPGKRTDAGTREAPTPKDLRPAFACLSYSRDMPKDSQGQPLEGTEIMFKGSVLGHYIEDSAADKTLNRLSSTLSYYGYLADAVPDYPATIAEKTVKSSCYESDREWLNGLVEGKTQAETFRYLRRQHEALQREVLDLKHQLRVAKEAQPDTPAPSTEKTQAAPTGIEKQLADLTAQVAALSQSNAAPVDRSQYKKVAEPTAPTARLEGGRKKTNAETRAHQWLDTVIGAIKDHNAKADGNIWEQWAISRRMLKDISKVSQRLVDSYWLENETEIAALNESWGLDNQHNRRRGMRKENPKNDFNLVRNS